jgi:Glyoxalase-like domain
MPETLQVVIDCADPARIAGFWAEALGYVLQPPPDGFDTWEDALRHFGVPEEKWGAASAIVDPDGKKPRIYFQQVPEQKSVKNRVHIDINMGTRAMPGDERRGLVDEHVEKLTGLGATRLRTQDEHGEYCVTMQDPEGNEFCVQ